MGGLVIADGHNFPCPCWGLSGLQNEDEIGTVFSSSPNHWVMLGTLILKDERRRGIHHSMLQRLYPVRLIVCLRPARGKERKKGKSWCEGNRAAVAIWHLCSFELSRRPTVYLTACLTACRKAILGEIIKKKEGTINRTKKTSLPD